MPLMIWAIGSWLSFDLMSELVFGKAYHMLDIADYRYIIDLIQMAAFRVGVCLQMPQLKNWKLDKILAPRVRKLRDGYVKVSHEMAVERMNMDSQRKDLFSHILAAKDPMTGKGFSMDEIWGESTLLIIAGIYQDAAISYLKFDEFQVLTLSRLQWLASFSTWDVIQQYTLNCA